jgi:peptidoglycan/xylan/chitin deacetylase (PgdA/CDA1 family)
MKNLWSSNTPAYLWQCLDDIPEFQWRIAIQKARSALYLPDNVQEIDDLLEMVLGEGQFGKSHWQLTPAKRIYFILKPFIPRVVIKRARRIFQWPQNGKFLLRWPIEDRYVRFQWEIMRQLLMVTNKSEIIFKRFWPDGKKFAFILTHDVETAEGFSYVKAVADSEEKAGFRSSFNFVPERYPIDHGLLRDLRQRGFEIGIHGLNHDAKLFSSYADFMQRVPKINGYMKAFEAVGFRSPYTMRQPEWMQALDIEYDLTFFDTDPFEPVPGGTVSIWPFTIGKFLELPYTLVQDNSLMSVVGETSPKIWLNKVDFICRFQGMALLNSHPDYLKNRLNFKIYKDFINAVKDMDGYWSVLPRDAAKWWRYRTEGRSGPGLPAITMGKLSLSSDGIDIN